MTQTRRMSAAGTAAGTAILFTTATLANYLVLPLWGLHPSPTDSLSIALFYTGLSLAQGYPIRRFFNWLNTRKDPFK